MAITITRPKAKKPKRVTGRSTIKKGSASRARGVAKVKVRTVVNK